MTAWLSMLSMLGVVQTASALRLNRMIINPLRSPTDTLSAAGDPIRQRVNRLAFAVPAGVFSSANFSQPTVAKNEENIVDTYWATTEYKVLSASFGFLVYPLLASAEAMLMKANVQDPSLVAARACP